MRKEAFLHSVRRRFSCLNRSAAYHGALRGGRLYHLKDTVMELAKRKKVRLMLGRRAP